MVRLGLIALDGTKIEANAATTANRTHAHLETQVAELLAQAAAADRPRTASTAPATATSSRRRWPAGPSG